MKAPSKTYCHIILEPVIKSDVEQEIIKNSTKRSNSRSKKLGGVLFYSGFLAD